MCSLGRFLKPRGEREQGNWWVKLGDRKLGDHMIQSDAVYRLEVIDAPSIIFSR